MRTFVSGALAAVAGLLVSGGTSLAAGFPVLPLAVPGHTGPWTFVAGGLNSNYPYGETGGRAAPVVIDSSSGFAFTPGYRLSLTYVSGTVRGNNGNFPYTDANGDPTKERESTDASNGDIYPAKYMSTDQYPVYAFQVIGVFTDANGALVGTPLKIGNAATLSIPAGAVKLDVGLNDDYFGDNSGAYNFQVTESVPEPSAIAAIGGMVLLAAGRRRRTAMRPFARVEGL